MTSLSPDYLRRLEAPTGLGDLLPADAAGEVGSVVGGSGVRVTLRFAPSAAGASGPRRIAAAGFRPFGSAAPLAPGSVLCERLVSLDDPAASALRPIDLLDGFGGPLPSAVPRAAERLIEALAKALSDPSAAAAARASSAGVLVCRCLGVGDRTIRAAIRGGASDVESVGHVTSAGHGCHSCWPDLRTLLDEESHPSTRSARSGPSAAAGVGAPRGGRRAENPDATSRAIDAVVRPLWRAQGLDLGKVAVEGERVLLEVAATRPGALASELGGLAIARHALREVLSESVLVESARRDRREDAPDAHVRRTAAR